ncbi:M90 family metallopeptidase [Flavobacterium coralii]|uniref:M90 family metallopeptidase n=1 Tax=Flavobacterium coralii TaxID=2838017 RepID=UPI000C6832A5|nr:peptidase [Flavobacterium sp.]|tara:strand:- start:6247 stop:7026 length:780 start_codon:yes stop_codon:yes gene_type:complete
MAFYIALAVFAIIGIYIYTSTSRRAVNPFPEEWKPLLAENVAYYRNLKPERQVIFRKKVMQFLSEVYIDGVGTEITDLDKILIAASAVIPVFGFKEWHYYNLSGVLLYPDHFNHDLEFADTVKDRNIGGLIGTGRFEKQMVLSRKALYHGFRNITDKSNTGIHEFVHLIDKMDDMTDGVPEHIMQQEYVVPWLDLIHREMEAINDDDSDIRKYGATNRAEFFAVASEYFFERPGLLKRKHPELYRMLTSFFKQKPKPIK